MRKLVLCFLILLLLSSYSFADQVIIFGDGRDEPKNTSAENITLMGDITWSGESPRTSVVATAGTLGNLRVMTLVPPGSGKSYVYTVRYDSGGGMGDSSVSCTISGDTDTACQDADTFAISVGDRLSFRSTPSGTPTQPGEVNASMKFVPTTADYSLMISSGSPTATYGLPNMALNTSNDDVFTVISTDGTMRDLYFWVDPAPGAGNSRTITLQKNYIDTVLSCTISGTDTFCQDTDTVDVVPDDELVYTDSSVTPDALTSIAASIVFQPDVEGEFIISGATAFDILGPGTFYNYLTAFAQLSWGAEEAPVGSQAMTITNLNVRMESNLSAGESADWTLRTDSGGGWSDTALTLNIPTGTKDNTASTDVSIADDELLTMKVVASGGSLARRSSWSVTGFIAPVVAGIIKTLNGLAWGSVKTRNGLAVGSVKTLSGAATQ